MDLLEGHISDTSTEHLIRDHLFENMTLQEPTEKSFRFFDLPKELRLMVYENIPNIIQHYKVNYINGETLTLVSLIQPTIILSTCRQINDEAAAIAKKTAMNAKSVPKARIMIRSKRLSEFGHFIFPLRIICRLVHYLREFPKASIDSFAKLLVYHGQAMEVISQPQVLEFVERAAFSTPKHVDDFNVWVVSPWLNFWQQSSRGVCRRVNVMDGVQFRKTFVRGLEAEFVGSYDWTSGDISLAYFNPQILEMPHREEDWMEREWL